MVYRDKGHLEICGRISCLNTLLLLSSRLLLANNKVVSKRESQSITPGEAISAFRITMGEEFSI